MNLSTRVWAFGLAVIVLNLSGLACSSSTPLKKAGDAASTPDLALAPDGGADVAGPDLPGPDLAKADLPTADTLLAGKDAISVADLPGSKDTLGLADLHVGKDLPQSDLPIGNDTTDLPVAVSDAAASEVPGADVPPSDGIPRDGPTDGPWGCNADAGAYPGCNDDPISAAIMGTCQPDGTCACKSPYVINPSTGRCRYPLRDASIFTDTSPAAACTGEYTACGCGCCGGVQPTLQCYYPSLGETIAAITAQDQATKNATNCESAGCGMGIRHLCCAEPAPDSPAGVTYAASGYSGGLEHVTISKAGSDCATLSFAKPMTSTSSPLKISMPSSWGVAGSAVGICGGASATDQAKGGVGTFVLRASGGDCVADLHVTLFAFTTDGTVKASRMDVDGIVVTGLPGGMCP